VLWLSPTAFITTKQVKTGIKRPAYSYEYYVELALQRQPLATNQIDISMHSLGGADKSGVALNLRLSLFLKLLRHLMKDLSPTDLRYVRLGIGDGMFPSPELLESFFSIVSSTIQNISPSSCSRQRPYRLCFPHVPDVVIEGILRPDQLQAVKGYLNSGHLRASFWGGALNHLVRLDVRTLNCEINAELRSWPALPHASVHGYLLSFGTGGHGGLPFTVNPSIESFSIHIPGEYVPEPMYFLDGVTVNPTIQHLHITLVSYYHTNAEQLEHIVGKVLPDHPSLKKVEVSFEGEETDDPLKPFVSVLSGLKSKIQGIKLLYFSITWIDKSSLRTILSCTFQNWWDRNMVPVLVMNWYHYEQEQRPKTHSPPTTENESPLLALSILDVNRGNIYRLVTGHAGPCDMLMANASLIFELFRDAVT
jgi:hypothetical protein